MEALSKLHIRPRPHRLVIRNRPIFTASGSSIALTTPTLHLASFTKSQPVGSIKASAPASLPPSSSSSSSSSSVDRNTTNHVYEAVKLHLTSLLKIITCVAVAAAALMMARFRYGSFPAIGAPMSVAGMIKGFGDEFSDEEKEKILEMYLSSHPDNVEALRSLMDLKIDNQKLQEAINLVDHLIQIEPEEKEWPLLKAQLHNCEDEHEIARELYEGILLKDPVSFEAYHGLVMALSLSGSGDELKKFVQRIEQAMNICEKEGKKDDWRNFKLLIAQIRVYEDDYIGALMVYQELEKDDPRDFRPYLCQGLMYTLLKKKDEAEKQFEKYKRLVPRDHPYAQYIDDTIITSKAFLQNVGRETASSKC